ncbi:HAD family hydrolase [Fusibacter sp. JL216-2]|uniref:HAD family hydrolase n=1 Tax=Fusibacter sp. JL216-2 TaxID=3071453 RepID=UPI003D34A95B
MYKHIVFDVDGTLINTEEAIITSLQKVLLKETGKTYEMYELDFVLGVPGSYSIVKFDLNNPSKALDKWQVGIKEHAHLNSIYEGILKLVTTLREMGHKLGIVTSRRDSECDSDPLFNTLKPYFDCIVTADRTEKHKPQADPLLYYMDKTQAKASETVYIGDTPYDSACADKAGVDFMVAGWGAKHIASIPNKDVLIHPYEFIKYVTR